MAGRKKKPLALRKLEGRTNLPEEPCQESATAFIPDWLPPAGKEFLLEYGPRLRRELGIKAIDEPVLFMIAATYGNAIAAQRVLNEEGHVIPDREPDVMRKSPHEAVMRTHASLFVSMATKFGMTPVDRIRLLTTETKAVAEDSVLDGAWKDPAERRRVQ